MEILEARDKIKARDIRDQVKVEDLVAVIEGQEDGVGVVVVEKMIVAVVVVLVIIEIQGTQIKKDFLKNPCLDQLQNNKNTTI